MVTVNRGDEYGIVAADGAVWEQMPARLRKVGHPDADIAAGIVTRSLTLYFAQNHGRKPVGPFGITFPIGIAGCVVNAAEWVEWDADHR